MSRIHPTEPRYDAGLYFFISTGTGRGNVKLTVLLLRDI